jgi:hypothetical protein
VADAFSFDDKFIILLPVYFLAKCPFTTLFIFVAATLSTFLFCRSVFNPGCSDKAFSYLSLKLLFLRLHFVNTMFWLQFVNLLMP